MKSPEERKKFRTFLSVPQAAWWILTRDEEALPGRSVEWASLILRYAKYHFESGRKRSRSNSDIASLSALVDAFSDLYSPDVEAALKNLRLRDKPNARLLVLPRSSERIRSGVADFQTIVPDTSPDVLRLALIRHAIEFHCSFDVFNGMVQLRDELARGSLSASGRKNGIFDRTEIDPMLWSDLMLLCVAIDIAPEFSAVPRDSIQGALAIFSARYPHVSLEASSLGEAGRASFWSDILVRCDQVHSIWPPEQGASDQRPNKQPKRANKDRDEKLRRFHTQLLNAIPRQQPRGLAVNRLAEKLTEDPAVQASGYKYETIRKILRGTYGPFKERGLVIDLPGTNTRTPGTNTRKHGKHP